MPTPAETLPSLYATFLPTTFATQLFKDVERRRFVAVMDGELAEGSVYRDPWLHDWRVTYSAAEAQRVAA